jgi:hypothetical protein
MKLVTIAEPRPVVTLTLSPPIMLQMDRYQIIFLFPYLWNNESVRSGTRESNED